MFSVERLDNRVELGFFSWLSRAFRSVVRTVTSIFQVGQQVLPWITSIFRFF